MGLGNGGNVRTDIYNGSTYVSLITTGLNVEDGAWHHLCATYDGSNYKFYVDGVLEKSSTGNTGFVTTNDASLIIGDDSCCANREFDGQIDDVRIYNYARTPGQIVEDMNAGHPIGGSPIGSQIAYYKLDKGYGTTAYDQLGNNNGTLTNSPTWTNDGKHNKALNFNSFDTEYVFK